MPTKFGSATKQNIGPTRRSQGKDKTRKGKSASVFVCPNYKICLLTQFFSHSQRQKCSCIFLNGEKNYLNFKMYLSKLQKDRTATQFLLSPILICRDKKTKIFVLSPGPVHMIGNFISFLLINIKISFRIYDVAVKGC